MTQYEILTEIHSGKGPYSGQEIEDLIQSGEIRAKDKVRKVHSGKVIEARVALLSANANDNPPESKPTTVKFVVGLVLIAAAIGIAAFFWYAEGQGETPRRRGYILPLLLIIWGLKMAVSNAVAMKNKRPAEIS